MTEYSIPFIKKIQLILKGAPVSKIKKCLEKCEHHSLKVNCELLEKQYFCNCDIEELIDGMIYIKEKGIKFSEENMVARHLAVNAMVGEDAFLEYLKTFVEKGVKDLDAAPIYQENKDA